MEATVFFNSVAWILLLIVDIKLGIEIAAIAPITPSAINNSVNVNADLLVFI